MNKEDRKDLVERLRDISRGDHERGCQGREYVCSCDYDETSWKTAEEAAAEIDRLRRELEEARRALEPFATAVEKADASAAAMGFSPSFDAYAPEWSFTFGQLRAARAALRAEEEGK